MLFRILSFVFLAVSFAAPAFGAAPNVVPYFSNGFASLPEVRRVLGEVRRALTNCQEPGYFNSVDERRVVVIVSRIPEGGLTAHGAVADAVLLDAAQFAWSQCPQPFVWVDGKPTGDFHYDVGSIEVYGPNDEQLLYAELNGEPLSRWGDQALSSSPRGYQFRDVRDLAAEDAAAAQQEQAAAYAREERALALSAQAADRRSSTIANLASMLVFGLLIWAFLKREAIARWYYSLSPHPAQRQVDAAIFGGEPIDGALYQEIIDSTYGGPIENDVRSNQANDLTSRLRRHESALRAEEAKQVLAAKEEAERDAAFMRAHMELLRAGVDHEDAAARLDELRRIRRK